MTVTIITDEEYEGVEALDQGMEAWQKGTEKSECPYESDTRKREEWINGYEVMILSEADLAAENA